MMNGEWGSEAFHSPFATRHSPLKGHPHMQLCGQGGPLARPLAVCAGRGVFTGYASLFGRRDAAGDVVMPGAFAETLKRRGADQIRMLFQHDPAEPVGTWVEIREDHLGLFVTGRLDCNVQRGRELLSLLDSRGLDGLSIGFRTQFASRDKASGTRRLHRIDLWEVSLVTFPMLDGARVSAVKRRALQAAELLFKKTTLPQQGEE
jgi:uncharacterized protein